MEFWTFFEIVTSIYFAYLGVLLGNHFGVWETIEIKEK